MAAVNLSSSPENKPASGTSSFYLQWLNRLLQTHPRLEDELSRRRSKLLASMALVVFVIGAASLIYQVMQRPDFIDNPETWVVVGGLAGILVLYTVNRRGYVNAAAAIFVGIVYTLFVFMPFIPGANDDFFYFSISATLLAAVFFSLRAAVIVAVSAFTFIVVLNSLLPSGVTIWMIQFLILGNSVIFVFINHLQFQESVRSRQLEIANHMLRSSEENLEHHVQERTRDLQIAADVSVQINTVLDPAQLLADVVERTAQAFNLYHVSIFLYDEDKGLLHLEQASGAVGNPMVVAGRQFRLSDGGPVPRAARTRQYSLSNELLSIPDYLPNPLLPDTRSELAIPMIYGKTLIGVLDIQSDQVNRFRDEDIRIMRTLSEQIAIAVRNSQLFEETRIAKDQAEKANTVKSAFLASMSHELRTPLNAIINFTKFVAKGAMGPVNDEQRETLNEVIDSGKHLLNLINDVLDMSKIEAGSLKLFVEQDIDLQPILKSIVSTGQTLIGDKPVALVADISENLPLMMGDRQRIVQVLLNILSNACKFTDEGSVTLRAYSEDGHVFFAIADTGPGIAPEDHALVFESFQQTERGLRQGGGTGLGMPISRSLVEAHGGRLWLESERGQGATFYVALPIQSDTLKPLLIA